MATDATLTSNLVSSGDPLDPMCRCAECGMRTHDAGEYHPYAACLMFKACGDRATVLANLNAVMDTGKGLPVETTAPLMMNDLPYHLIPQDIIDKVVEVRRWFAERNVKRWSVAGVGPLHVEPTAPPPDWYCPNCDCDLCGAMRGRLERSAVKATPVTWTCPSCGMRGRPPDAYVCVNCGEKRPENGGGDDDA